MSKAPIQIVTLIYNSLDGGFGIYPCPIFYGVNKFSVALRSLFINNLTYFPDPTIDLGINVTIFTGECNHRITADDPPVITTPAILATIPIDLFTFPAKDCITYQNPDCYNSRMLFTTGGFQSLRLFTAADNIRLFGGYCQATLCFYEEPDSFSNFSLGQS